ncbi:nucleic acid-binding, OB-fold protein [Tanacetum coccineum]
MLVVRIAEGDDQVCPAHEALIDNRSGMYDFYQGWKDMKYLDKRGLIGRVSASGDVEPLSVIVELIVIMRARSYYTRRSCDFMRGCKAHHKCASHFFREVLEAKRIKVMKDVIGHVVACEDPDNYDKNGKLGKKKPLTLVDAQGNELKCTLWSAFAQQFSNFLSTCSDDGKICVQNGYRETKLFAFDGSVPIVKEEFSDVKEYSMRLFAKHDIEKSVNTYLHSLKKLYQRKFCL